MMTREVISETLKGIIKNVRYYNKTSGYTVASIEMEYKDHMLALKKAKIIGNTVTVVGILDREPFSLEEYTFEGIFIEDPNHGLQFSFTHFKRHEVATVDGVVSYLCSDMFPEIGPKTARMIAEVLGEKAIELIANDRNILDKVKIPDSKKDIIYQVITDNKNIQEKILFFLNNGLTMDMTLKIIAILGEKAVENVKENPYVLMEKIERLGFKKNDAFALNLGIRPDDPVRLEAAAMFVLSECIFASGNTYINRDVLFEQIRRRFEGENFILDQENFQKTLDELTIKKKILVEKDRIFHFQIYYEECRLAERIAGLFKNDLIKAYEPEEIKQAFQKVITESKIEYSEKQRLAISSAFTEPVVIITGGPGTGKTTIVHAIIRMFLELSGGNENMIEEIALLAPTGRAAKRLKESTGINAMTIHRFLEYQGNNVYEFGEDNLTSSRLIIIDEASMMDVSLAYRLFTSMNPNARIILVGDVDQLPSVGPGQVLADMINTRLIKVIRLDKIHRQAENSNIIRLAHEINEGQLPEDILEKLPDRNFIPTEEEYISSMIKKIVEMTYNKGIDLSKNFQILVPLYRGPNGINEINKMVQEIVNPLTFDSEEIDNLGRKFRVNDKVIQLVNRTEKQVMNGDIGIINSFLYQNGKKNGLTVLYDIGPVNYTMDELEDISHAYAISIHKSQGSEFNIVLMPISSSYTIMLKRKLIYTGITRAKKTLLMLGNIKSLNRGITQIEVKRDTILEEKIREAMVSDQFVINDSLSAFPTIGEIDFGKLSPKDFQ
jgi:exodeoxyribonuclease V alpha subunit